MTDQDFETGFSSQNQVALTIAAGTHAPNVLFQ
jgi:hypothetical protein